MIKSDIISIINKYPIIALAVSGGSDSMVMAEWFLRNRAKETFIFLNIDHSIRGEDSKQDSEFVAAYCKANAIKLLQYKVDVPAYSAKKGMSLEQAAREMRHEIFRQVCVDHAYVVATAHHESDQVESILMHISRGSGISGLTGMRAEDGYLIRPLINTTKDQILQYIKQHNIDYREDSSNKDTTYSRNYMRQEIIPTIESRYPMLKASVLRLSSRAEEVMDYIDSMTPALTVNSGAVACDIKCRHKVIAVEMLRRAFSLLGVESDIEERHIELLLELARQQNGTKLNMPHKIVAYNENGEVVITKAVQIQDINIPFGEGMYDLNGSELIIEKVKARIANDNALYIAGESIPADAVIRYRKDGDEILKFGGGRKSLGDFFTDKKIAVRLRSTTPVIASGNDILCVVGLEISKQVQIEESTSEIYKIQLILS